MLESAHCQQTVCPTSIVTAAGEKPYPSEESPMVTSGIRLGSQAATTRGFGLKEFEKVGELITKTIKGLSDSPNNNKKIED